jgi:protein-glutamine gamma-glutamyltransferase
MRFSAIHKIASYLMIASAFAALALSRELSALTILLTLGAGAVSFGFEASRHAWLRERWWTTVWNLGLLGSLAWFIVDALRGELLYGGVRFLCFLIVNKLWNRRGSRDYLQAYVVSFLMLVAGAALSSDLSYAACFVAYVVFATWTLTLFHLRREMEENYLLKHSDGAQSERVEVDRILNSRRIVGGSFLLATSVVSVFIFVCATLVFFMIPRIGFGFFVNHGRRNSMTVGFSERVDLGEYGLIKSNPQVVMRIELPSGPPMQPLHLRGVSFDRYQSGHWVRTDRVPTVPLRRFGPAHWLVGIPPRERISPTKVKQMLSKAMVQNVYLDPLDTPVLFGAAQPAAFEIAPTLTANPVELEGRGPDEIYAMERHVDVASGRIYGVERKTGLRYTVYSESPALSPAELSKITDVGQDPGAARGPDLQPYLQLPTDLPPRVAELARKLTQGVDGPYNKARVVERFLQTRLKYTLDLKRDTRYEPLEDFLFVQKAGHCAYFASAMAVMLRVVGLPTRSVNGFLAQEWNGYGHYLAVRQQDAHSWVEVWIDGAGWITFDPTPTTPAAILQGGFINKLRQMADTAELAWFKYVIEYDLAKQADVVNSVRDYGSDLFRTASLKERLKRAAPPLGGLAALAAVVALLMRRARRTSLGPAARHVHADSAYGRALRALEKRGLQRGAGETGRELAARARAANDPGASPFAALVELYYAARYGGEAVPSAELDRLADGVIHPLPKPNESG